MKQSVLFVCTGNSARSQMAEALLRNHASGNFDVYGAGTAPEPVDQRAIDALARLGASTEGLHCKGLDQFEGKSFDYVISLCGKAKSECKQFTHGKVHMAWDFADPKTRRSPAPFHVTLSELNQRINMFVLVQDKEGGSS